MRTKWQADQPAPWRSQHSGIGIRNDPLFPMNEPISGCLGQSFLRDSAAVVPLAHAKECGVFAHRVGGQWGVASCRCPRSVSPLSAVGSGVWPFLTDTPCRGSPCCVGFGCFPGTWVTTPSCLCKATRFPKWRSFSNCKFSLLLLQFQVTRRRGAVMWYVIKKERLAHSWHY